MPIQLQHWLVELTLYIIHQFMLVEILSRAKNSWSDL